MVVQSIYQGTQSTTKTEIPGFTKFYTDLRFKRFCCCVVITQKNFGKRDHIFHRMYLEI